MLLVHYRHRLPADYEMTRIAERIATRGPSFDATPGLGFKAFAASEQARGAGHNAYASLYLWLDPRAATDMLSDARFAAVVDSFGRPSVATWLPFDVRMGRASTARSLHREETLLPEGEDLARRWQTEAQASRTIVRDESILATVVGLDPARWSLTRFTLSTAPAEASAMTIGHLAAPGLAALRDLNA